MFKAIKEYFNKHLELIVALTFVLDVAQFVMGKGWWYLLLLWIFIIGRNWPFMRDRKEQERQRTPNHNQHEFPELVPGELYVTVFDDCESSIGMFLREREFDTDIIWLMGGLPHTCMCGKCGHEKTRYYEFMVGQDVVIGPSWRKYKKIVK